MARKKQTFETRLSRLNEVVEQLERGDLPLEQGMAFYKEGVELVKRCREELNTAKHEVRILQEGVFQEFAPEGETESEHETTDGEQD